jgi:hypothetical protein
MPDPRSLPDDRPNIGSEPLEDELLGLEGEAPIEDQDAVVDPDEVEDEQEDLPARLDYPPLVSAPGDPDQIEVPGSEDQDEAEGSLNARIREALRSDASTSALADQIEIAVVGSTAILRGQVDGLEDSDALVDVASGVEGIDDVRDETEVAGL